MAEILNPPVIDANGNATFSESSTIADIVRYAIDCSDVDTVLFCVMEEIKARSKDNGNRV